MDEIETKVVVSSLAEIPQMESESDADMNEVSNAQLGGKMSPLDAIETYLLEKYDFRRNVIIEKTEFKVKANSQYVAMTDRDYNSLFRELQKNVGKFSLSNLRGLLNSDFVDRYNPFIEYIDSLPKWDGQTDHILELAKTVHTTNDEFWHECFRRWFVAFIGCATVDSIINHTVIVFAGKQGIGKTTWHMNLVPDLLKDYRYSGMIKPSNKDSILQLAETMLINLDELQSLNKSEVGDLKEMVTKGHIRLRRAYGFNHERYVRRASFTGSVNNSQFLNDTTGSRRFLCFEVLGIDYQHKVKLEMAIAQAKYLLDHGFKYWFDDSEIDAITKNNERYQVLTVEEELLMSHYEPTAEGEQGMICTATELAGILTQSAKISLSNTFVNNLGKALMKNKFKRVKRYGVYCYIVKKRNG
jgi:predicted P-loop ATPase